MSKLPRVSGRDVAAALVLRNPRPPFRRIVVPDHREIAKGTLRAIIREAGISLEVLTRLL